MKKIIKLIFLLALPGWIAAQTTAKDTVNVKPFEDLTLVTDADVDTSDQFLQYDISAGLFSYRLSLGELLKKAIDVPNIVGSSQIVNGSILDTDISGSAGIGLNKLAATAAGRLLLTDSGGAGTWVSGTPGYGLTISGTSILADTSSASGLVSKSRLTNALDDVGGGSGLTLQQVLDSTKAYGVADHVNRYERVDLSFTGWRDSEAAWTFSGDTTTRDPSNVIYWGGKYYFYGSWFLQNEFAGDTSEAIQVFESLHPMGPYTAAGQVLTIGAGGTYDASALFTPNVVVHNDSIYLFYSAYDGGADVRWNIGLAVSASPTSGFTKRSNPVLYNKQDAGNGAGWDDLRVDEVHVMRWDSTTWRMYYKGVTGTPPSLTRKVGFAETSNANFPTGWTKYSGNPILDATDINDGSQPESICVWRQNGTYWMSIAPNSLNNLEFFESSDGINWTYKSNITATSLGVLTGNFHGHSAVYDKNGMAGLIYHNGSSSENVQTIRFLVSNLAQITRDTSGSGGGGLWTQNGTDIYYNSGEVGIGLTSPTWPLEVQKSITGGLSKFENTNASGYAVTQWKNSAGNILNMGIAGPSAGAGYAGQAYLQNNGLGSFFFDSDTLDVDGLLFSTVLGVGTKTPSAPIHAVKSVTTGMQILENTNASGFATTQWKNDSGDLINFGVSGSAAPGGFGSGQAYLQVSGLTDMAFSVTNANFSSNVDIGGILTVTDTSHFDGKLNIYAATEPGFYVRNTAATFGNELSAGSVGNPNYIANWKSGAQDDVSKPSWLLGLQINNDKAVFQRRAAGGGSFADVVEVYLDSLVMNGDIRTVGGAFIDDGTTITAPDYVFEDSYNFLPIRDYINTIKGQKHLIGARSARELKKDIPITEEMFANREAIENNVLYIEILLDKIEALEKRVKQLEKQ